MIIHRVLKDLFRWINSYCIICLIITNVFSSVVANLGKNEDRNNGRWYDKTKWSSSTKNQPALSSIEGSGNGDVVSDLDEVPKGLGPDDEDSDSGSGAMERPNAIEEGSGAGGLRFEAPQFTTTTFSYTTHMTTSNVTTTQSQLGLEGGAFFSSKSIDSTTQAALFLSSTLAQQPITQQEPVHSTHVVTKNKLEDPDIVDESKEEGSEEDEDDEDYNVHPDGTGNSIPPPLVPLLVDYSQMPPVSRPVIVGLQTTAQWQPAIDPLPDSLPGNNQWTTAPPPIVGPTTVHSMYDTTPDKRGERNGFEWVFSTGVLTAVIGGAVVGLLAAILLVMFVVYRMRKKDEGSYVLDEPKAPPTYPYAYNKAPAREFYA